MEAAEPIRAEPHPEEEEDDDDDDEEEEEPEHRDGVHDAGVAEAVEIGKERRKASEADITLFIRCTENFPHYPDHPILKPGVTVQIGLDKSTKLAAVFDRFACFCGERGGSPVDKAHLEFVHSQVLLEHDTAETSALMKNDQITVRLNRADERRQEAKGRSLQREIDRNFFQQLQGMIPPSGNAFAPYYDTIIDCQGAVLDEAGRAQRVLSTVVRCHSVIVKKRCRWLGRLIDAARVEQSRRGRVVNIVEVDSRQQNTFTESVSKDCDEEDDIRVLNLDEREPQRTSAAQIENDDDEQLVSDAERHGMTTLPESDDVSLPYDECNLLRVTLPNHSPDAVRVLLEYCYTNRVVDLGLEAFVRACKTSPTKDSGPSLPYPMRRWPNHGRPMISFRTALSALALAEEASMPRLSLMCEVAASQLVEISTVVDALSICETQRQATGNALVALRKAAIDVVLRSGPRGVYALPTFRRALQERGASLVPTLLIGTAEAVDGPDEKKREPAEKRDWMAMALDYFDDLDYSDACAREKERQRSRIERLNQIAPLTEEEVKNLFEKPIRKDEPKRKSLKRMAHQLSGGRAGNRVVASKSGGGAHRRSLG